MRPNWVDAPARVEGGATRWMIMVSSGLCVVGTAIMCEAVVERS